MLGTFLLWFGWYGFNTGNAFVFRFDITSIKVATLAAVNTTLSAGSGGICSLLLNLWYTDRMTGEGIFDLQYAMNGVLSGLVAITASCGVVEPWAALIIGILSGFTYTISSRLLVRYQIDDAVDAIPVHLFNGILSVIMTGLLASPSRLLDAYGRNHHVGLFYSWAQGNSDFVLFGIQLLGVTFVIGWVMFFMIPFFTWLDFMGWFRSDPLEEIVGLDTSYHGGLTLLSLRHDHEVSEQQLSEFKRQKLEAKMVRQRVLQIANEQHRKEMCPKTENKNDNTVPSDEKDDDLDNDDDDEDINIIENIYH
jgi:ammonium transporter, Amt family